MSSFKQLGGNPDWWRGGAIYQIYPRSYQDSTGDGIGDIPGIISRLDHIQSLGVEAIWISPFFKSPMKDFGYDVSDYRDIDPMFGTLNDFDRLILEAHKRGLRIIIDLVLSHSSDQHAFFQESKQSRDNPKSDWYVWADPKPDGTPPNNWLSIFGGSAWEWNAKREQYYLHNFLTSQPDLNLHNMDVQNEILDITRFWLDRGVDGYRLDTINFYFADKELRDNPALPPEKRNSTIAPSVNPYNHQEHIYSKNQPENLVFLERFRALLDEYPATTIVGELGEAQRGLEMLGEYTRGNSRAHMCYAFEFLSGDHMNAERASNILNDFKTRSQGGTACWAFSNHDVTRHKTRWGLSDSEAKLVLSMLVAMPGAFCIYQGEEFGFHEAEVAFDDLQDPYGITFWPEYKGRDGCRTPMPWTNNGANGGFSEGKPWLPVSAAHIETLEMERLNDEGILAHYREMIGLRNAQEVLQNGNFEVSHNGLNELTIRRFSNDGEIIAMFNFGVDGAQFTLPSGSNWEIISGGTKPQDSKINVAAKEAVFVKKV